MKCPLRVIAISQEITEKIPASVDCIKEDCAWWEEIEEGCILMFIEKDLAFIGTMLTCILNKMPHE